MALSVRFHPAARTQLFELYEYIAAETGRDRCSRMLLMIPNLLAGLVRYRERDGAKLRS